MMDLNLLFDSSAGRKRTVLFLCTHNSARSQMAEGWLRHLYGERYEVFSAGTQPTRVHPLAVQVMAERGVDLSSHTSTSVEQYLDRNFDLVVTVCDHAREACPVFPGARRTLHRSFPDPTQVQGSPQEQLQAFRQVRDQIYQWILETFHPASPDPLSTV